MIASIDAYNPYEAELRSLTVREKQEFRIDCMPSSSLVIREAGQIRRSLNRHIFKLLKEYSTLQVNWDGDDALAPSEKVLEQAIRLSEILDQYQIPIYHTAPGSYGEIMLELRGENNGNALEFIFYPSRAVYVHFPLEGEASQGVFRMEELFDYLRELNA